MEVNDSALRAAIAVRYPTADKAATDRAAAVVRDACRSDNPFVLPMMHDKNPELYTLAEVACPEQTAAG